MTNQEINIAIAEVCGWKRRQLGQVFAYYKESNPDRIQGGLPNYCTDLNAMHDAEKMLSENQDRMFSHYKLPEVCGPGSEPGTPLNRRKAIHATARQRAEAFLRTLGKWQEKGGAK